MKLLTWKQSFKVSAFVAIVALACFGIAIRNFRAHANAKALEFTSTEQMAKYNEIDRQVANLRLQIQILEAVEKKAIRESLGVPAGFVEKRIDPNSYNSMVVGFVEPSSSPQTAKP